MYLSYLALFLASLAFNIYALEVVIMDYSKIDYNTSTAYGPYPYTNNETCYCYDN